VTVVVTMIVGGTIVKVVDPVEVVVVVNEIRSVVLSVTVLGLL